MATGGVLCMLGSPRPRGNSTLLARSAARGVEAAGGVCELVTIQGRHIEPCRACDACRNPGRSGCVRQDDMQQLYPRLVEARAILIASPVYWFSLSAQTKLFLDRCYALHVPGGHAFAGKRFGLILTYGDADAFASGGINALRTIEDACRYLRAELVGVVHGTAGAEGEVATNEPLLRRAFELGEALAR